MSPRKGAAKPEPPAWAMRGRAKSVLVYFGDPETKAALDRIAEEDGLTRSQMIARLVERESKRRARRPAR